MKRTFAAALVTLVSARAAWSTSGAPAFAQGPKLVGTSVVGAQGSQQGTAVALSADGNTALVGGSWDDSQIGAAWVFTRLNGVWKQQQKLVGSGASGTARQGASVALSADGSTALLGAPFDASSTGAAWVFTRSGSTWTQQGGKLVGTGGFGATMQGVSVALSADGNTALVGGSGDNGGVGAAWVFRRVSGVWSQDGAKLWSSDKLGLPHEGVSVALSSDGTTAILGGDADNASAGALWVFVRTEGVWAAQGGKLTAVDAVGAAQLGLSVALSADGNNAIAGGPGDDSFRGAVFPFSRSGSTWFQDGSKVIGGVPSVGHSQGTTVAISGDANTILSGLPNADGGVGGAWVFTRTGNLWTARGSRLAASAAVGAPYLAQSMAISADATTVILGGPFDRSTWGAAWVYDPLGTSGDVNASGAVDVVDVFYLVNYLFAGGPAPH